MRRLIARDWMDDGFRVFKPKTFRWLRLEYRSEDFQGDIRESITLHVAGRAIEYTSWDVELR